MRGKIIFIAGMAAGYVLGARAGRKRYEQIASAASRVWETPAIQRQVHTAQDYAAAKLSEVPGAVIEGVKKIASSSNRGPSKAPRGAGSSGAGSVSAGQPGSASDVKPIESGSSGDGTATGPSPDM